MVVAHIILLLPDHRHCVRVIDAVVELIYVPVDTQQAGVDDAHILTEAFDLLYVPQRVGLVIAKGEEYSIWRAAGKCVKGHGTGQCLFRAVVVIPFYFGHQHGCSQQTKGGSCYSCGRPLYRSFEPVVHHEYAQPYPYSKCVGATCKCVVTLTWLQWRHVKVDADGCACKEEQGKHHNTIFLIPVELEYKPHDTEYQRKEVELVVCVVITVT